MEKKKVWVVSKIELTEGELEITDQEIHNTRDDAEGRWNELLIDVNFALEDMGAAEEDVEIEYDQDNLYYRMDYEGDTVWVIAKETECFVQM